MHLPKKPDLAKLLLKGILVAVILALLTWLFVQLRGTNPTSSSSSSSLSSSSSSSTTSLSSESSSSSSSVYEMITITFDSQGGTAVEPVSIMKDGPIMFGATSQLDTTKTGYTFAGWNRASDGSGTLYTGLASFSADVTLYAQWTINSYSITFDSQGGFALDAILVEFDAAIELPDDPTYEGFTFDGWFLDEELTEPFTYETMPAEDLTLFAAWTEVVEGPVFDFDDLSGEKYIEVTIPGSADEDIIPIVFAGDIPEGVENIMILVVIQTVSEDPEYQYDVDIVLYDGDIAVVEDGSDYLGSEEFYHNMWYEDEDGVFIEYSGYYGVNSTEDAGIEWIKISGITSTTFSFYVSNWEVEDLVARVYYSWGLTGVSDNWLILGYGNHTVG